MTGSSRTQARRTRRRGADGVRLLVAGALLSMLPAVMASSRPAQGLESSEPLGWLMLAAGACLVLGRRRLARRAAPAAVLAPGATVSSGHAMVPAGTAPAPAVRGVDAEAPTPRRLDAGLLRRLSGQRLCAVVETLFERRGFDIRRQPGAGPACVDLILNRDGQDREAAGIVRCLPAAGRPLDGARIREFSERLCAMGLRQGHFVTSALLTPETIALARTHGIELLDLDRLLRIAARMPSADQAALAAVALDDDAAIGTGAFPTAPSPVHAGRPIRTGNAVAVQLPGYLRAFRAAANTAAKSASPEPSTTKLVA